MRDIIGLVLFTVAVKIMRPQTLRAVMVKVDQKGSYSAPKVVNPEDARMIAGYAAMYAWEAKQAMRSDWHSWRCLVIDLAKTVGAVMVCLVFAVGLLTIGGFWR